jgi:guanylate kinase
MEQHGREYFFLPPEEFRRRIAAGDFLEYEEVYPGRFYGTLKSEVERILERGDHLIFDVDVVGGCRIKDFYGTRALSLFIKPPDIEALRTRLENRATESPDSIESRLAKAAYEMSFAPRFDFVIVNKELPEAEAEALHLVRTFLGR